MRILLVLLLLLSVNTLKSQIVEVENISELSITSQDNFYFPRFTPDGNRLLLTRGNLKGLWLYDLNQKSLVQLNNHQGAGYQPMFVPDQNKVVFRSHTFRGPKKYYSLHAQELTTRVEELLITEQRNLNAPVQLKSTVAYMQDDALQWLQPQTQGKLSKLANRPPDETLAMSYQKRIIIFENGVRKEIQPFGEAIYIWVSLSPNKDRLLFTHGELGTFISDLAGNILVELGRGVNAPRWSPDGESIVFMRDEDDGHVYTASDIFVLSADGQSEQQLTNTSDRIEMHPDWSPDGNKISFHGVDGTISIISLQSQ